MYMIRFGDDSAKDLETLVGANCQGADFRGADFRGADFQHADFRGAICRGADLREADFQDADCQGADCQGADFQHADCQGAIFRGASFQHANFRGADCRGADFRGANFRDADLRDIIVDDLTQGYHPVLSAGTIVVYKKVDGFLVTLRVPESALRSSGTTRKCRVSEAEVVGIVGQEKRTSVVSKPYNGVPLTYTVGETVYPDAFDEDRWNECSHGIHCFATIDEALAYK